MLRPRLLLQPAERYPADPRAVFILALSVFSGMVALVVEEAPGSIEEAVPTWGVVLWSIGLGFGSLLAILGLLRDNVNGIIVEQIGSVMVGAATLFYSTIAMIVVGVGAAQPLLIIFGWGVACMIRYWQLQLLLRRIHSERLGADAAEFAFSIIDSHARTEDPGV